MDKVIIDDIDVSECEFFDNYECNIYVNEYWESEDNTKDMCKWHENCYYKQLKRLEQENERLKEELRTEKIYSSQIEELEESLQHARSENKELSESIKRLKNMAKAAALGREKYKQALQEIRDVVSEQCQQCFVIDGFTKPDDCGICDYKRILDKINSVIGAEE